MRGGTPNFGWSWRTLLVAALLLARLSASAQPANDNFADAAPLAGTAFLAAGSNDAATREPGEPRLNWSTNGHSVWWIWQSPADGFLTLSTAGSSNVVVLDVFRGNSFSNLVQVASNNLTTFNNSTNVSITLTSADVAATYFTNAVRVPVEAGSNYFFAADMVSISGSNVTGAIQLGGNFSTFHLASPVNGQLALATQPLAVRAAFDSAFDGAITQVDFFAGTNALGSAGAPDFSLAWTPPVPGSYVLTAVATNALGEVKQSPAVTIRAVVPNDLFALAAPLAGTNATAEGDNSAATTEAGEPPMPGSPQGRTLWWMWTAPADGNLELSTAASSNSTVVAVYTGDTLTNLTRVATNNYRYCYERCGCGWRTRTIINFAVRGGVTYRIAADQHSDFVQGNGFTGILSLGLVNDLLVHGGGGIVILAGGSIPVVTVATPYIPPAPAPTPSNTLRFGLNFIPAPSNDRFANATALIGIMNTITAANLGAGKEDGEPAHGGNPGGRSLWYSWTAPVSGRVVISTNQPIFYDPPKWTGIVEVVVVIGGGSSGGGGYYGSYGSVTIINFPGYYGCGSGYDAEPPPPFFPVFGVYTGNSVANLTPVVGGTEAVFEAQAGTTYHIAMDGNLGAIGSCQFFVTQTPPPPNDNFAQRIFTTGTRMTATGVNISASREPGEPEHAGDPSGHSVWWSWVAPGFGTVSASLAGSDADFPFAVYQGTNVGGLRKITEGHGALSFYGAAGATYHFAIGADHGAAGKYTLNVTSPPVVISVPTLGSWRGIQYFAGFRGVDGQCAIVQALRNGQWTNLVILTVTNGIAFDYSLLGTINSSNTFRALLLNEPLPPPRVDAGGSGLLPDGAFRVGVAGITPQKFVLQCSSNLVDWVSLSTNVFNDGGFNYTDPPAPGAHSRFYRVVPAP
ncbi:MAG: Ig-like domain-containing protein [Verrucomicrobia bacterium]|nr:Ig-like domain-containing protein [Verrucomicrobiota bacterium]